MAGGVGGSELVLPGGFKDPVGKQIDEYFGKLIVDSDSWIKNMKQGHADNLSQLKTISASETPHHFIGHIFDQYGFSVSLLRNIFDTFYINLDYDAKTKNVLNEDNYSNSYFVMRFGYNF